MRLGAAIGLTLVAGCSLATIPNGVVLCSSGTCPSGFACQGDGHCWQLGTLPDAGGAPDAGRTDAGPVDAGNDRGTDAGFDGGPDGGFVCGVTDAGGCVICSADGALPDLIYPRWGLGGVYFKQIQNASVFERIYAVGGFDPSGATTADVEVDEFDTGSNWAPVGNANLTPRAFFPVVAQPVVGLIAIGGEDKDTGTILGDTVIFSIFEAPVTSSSWNVASARLVQPRENHAAVLEGDGATVITCGGSGSGVPLSSCETLDLAALDGGTWQPGPSMNLERSGVSMALGSDGTVYAFSGAGSSTSSLMSWETLGSNGSWGCPGTCPQMLSGHVFGAAAVLGSKIYVMGGVSQPADQTSNNVVEYLDATNPSAGWQQAAGMPTARSYFGAVATPTGTIRVFGGHGGPNNTCTIASVEEYTPSTNTWR